MNSEYRKRAERIEAMLGFIVGALVTYMLILFVRGY